MEQQKAFSSSNGHKNMSSEERGKIFVGGLNKITSTDTLRQFFCRFGEVEDAVAMWDRNLNRSRCFGYVKFRDPDVVQLVLRSKPHYIDDKEVDVKECLPRSVTMTQSQKAKAHKIFVGGLPPDIDEQTLRRAFQNYGKLTEVLIVVDPQTQKPKGFGFLSFEKQENAAAAVSEHYVMVNGKKVEVKALDATKGRQTHGGGPGGYHGGYPPHGGYYGQPPSGYGYGYQQGYPGPYGGSGQWSGGPQWAPEHHGAPMMGGSWGEHHGAPPSSWGMDPSAGHSWGVSGGWQQHPAAAAAPASGSWGDPSGAAWQHAYGSGAPPATAAPAHQPAAAAGAGGAQASWMMSQPHAAAPPGAAGAAPPGAASSQSYNYHPYRR